MKALYLWLDDIRLPPDGWDWARTYQQAIDALSTGSVRLASLDHDLGGAYAAEHSVDLCRGTEGCGFCHPEVGPQVERNLQHNVRTGYDVVLWMAEHSVWPTDGVVIHSWNSVGGERMRKLVDRYGPYDTPCRHIPDQRM